MLNLYRFHKTYRSVNFNWPFEVNLVLVLMICDFGNTGIVVYDGKHAIEEFPDIELSYTQPVKRNGIEGVLVAADPLNACVNISKPPNMNGSMNWFVLMSGSSCNFETKVLNAKLAGYSLGIIYTYRGRVEPSSNYRYDQFYCDMPTVVVKTEHGIRMRENYLFTENIWYRIVVFPNNSFSIMTFLLLFSIVAGLFLVTMLAFTVIRFFQQSGSVNNGRLSSQHLRQLQTTVYQKGDHYETCAICLEDFKDQDKLRILPCSHGYHMKCIDPWLTNNRRICPVCKRKVLLLGETEHTSSHNFEERAETTPLLQAGAANAHGTFPCFSATTPVNPNQQNEFMEQRVMGNVHSMPSGGAMPPERHFDGQYVLNFLQL